MSVHVDDARPGDALYDQILGEIQRPSRYIGGEWNQVVKDHRSVDVTFALGFPDVYEIGMSHLGFRILYSLLNARDDTAAERDARGQAEVAQVDGLEPARVAGQLVARAGDARVVFHGAGAAEVDQVDRAVTTLDHGREDAIVGEVHLLVPEPVWKTSTGKCSIQTILPMSWIRPATKNSSASAPWRTKPRSSCTGPPCSTGRSATAPSAGSSCICSRISAESVMT